MHAAQTLDWGHGRLERRQRWALPIYADFIAWPAAHLMLRLERTFIHKAPGELSRELDYALSSLDLALLDARGLRTLWRHPWHVENRLQYVRAVTLAEAASRVRSGAAPHVLAALRNVVMTAARQAGFSTLADALRTCAQQPYFALAQFIRL